MKSPLLGYKLDGGAENALVVATEEQIYRIQLQKVHGVLNDYHIFRVPAAKPGGMGMMIHQNRVVPIFSLGQKRSRQIESLRPLVLMDTTMGEIGLVVDRVVGIGDESISTPEAERALEEILAGLFKGEDE